eukprot:1748631-Alexandrium_andersonii.AAC.1
MPREDPTVGRDSLAHPACGAASDRHFPVDRILRKGAGNASGLDSPNRLFLEVPRSLVYTRLASNCIYC